MARLINDVDEKKIYVFFDNETDMKVFPYSRKKAAYAFFDECNAKEGYPSPKAARNAKEFARLKKKFPLNKYKGVSVR